MGYYKNLMIHVMETRHVPPSQFAWWCKREEIRECQKACKVDRCSRFCPGFAGRVCLQPK